MFERLLSHRLIPVVEIDAPDHAAPLAEALLEGGISIIEVTLRTPAAFDAIARIRTEFTEMLVGAGTVLNPEDAMRTLDAGTQFGVSPGLNADVVDVFRTARVPFVPGVLTPTEIESALTLDCTLLKYFPAQAAGGVAYLKAISHPYGSRGIRFCATGGIGLDSIGDYLALPSVSAIGGSWMATREQIGGEQWSTITRNSMAALARLETLGMTAKQTPGPRA
jgi:2-dehydro-3-deoxyphosphogluconate aldolase/(4S)-4-hydroxy-2-oxoglutarate aldolase